MTIEEEVFKRTKIDFEKILQYGFKKEKEIYQYSKDIMNASFRIDIEITNEGTVCGKIFDVAFEDEYTNFRMEQSVGGFVGQIREEFKHLLEDIRDKCFAKENFIFEQSNRITNLIKQEYGDEPQFEWEKTPGCAVFKNLDSQKWYGVIMNLDRCKLEEKDSGEVEILDIKLEPKEIEDLLKREGFYPAYHMNKKNWITIALDDTIPDCQIMELIQESHSYTISPKSNRKRK